MLLEKDYRGTEISLAYNGEPFSVPKNLYLIGMMNTADRSLAIMDYALRRRFKFYDMHPAFGSEGFRAYQKHLDNVLFDALIEQIKALNREIAEDASLGRGFCIGHSYFCGRTPQTCTEEWMYMVVEYDILPMLREYWFDEPEKVQKWEERLRGVLNDE
jgi:5-methylcytosine-specific restriction enzyme B